MIRRFGEPIEAGRRYTQRPGAYAVLWTGSQVLLTHQAAPTPETQLPGGGIDPGESPLHALHREVLEETGWTISEPVRLASYRRFTFMEDYDLWAEKLCHIYLARPGLCRGAPREAGHSVIWASAGAASELVESAGDRFFLRQALGLR